MKKLNRNSHFHIGSSVYICDVCGRATRHTGAQGFGSKLCPQCWDLAGIENEISDGHCTRLERKDEVEALIAEIAAKGGNIADWAHLRTETV